jgi:hypothetical protein
MVKFVGIFTIKTQIIVMIYDLKQKTFNGSESIQPVIPF